MALTRREFGSLAASLGAALAWPARSTARTNWRERREAFPQGVASGDPDTNSVILWTRREPEAGASTYRLTVEVSADERFERIVAKGTTEVGAGTDWTSRFLAAGLRPGREYWYRFTDQTGAGSRIGRTLTAPAGNDARPFRFAFVSCQDPTQGGMQAWRKMIFEDERRPPDERLGFVLHLGDFIYEVVWYPEDSAGGAQRGRRLRGLFRYPDGEKMRDFHLPTTLADYRTVYRAYLSDPDLQDARARWPFVAVWDNHEFSWQGWQSMQAFGGEVRPAQQLKVIANQAWFEFQPARVLQPGGLSLERFHAPKVANAPLTRFDRLGLGLEPNNLAAIRSLDIRRTLKWGANADLILTDNHSFHGEPAKADGFDLKGFPFVFPEEVSDILEGGSDHDGGNPPATIRWGDKDVPNPARDSPRQSYLGAEQKTWLLGELRGSKKPWKLWGHSAGTLRVRTDIQNLPEALRAKWPGAGNGLLQGGYEIDHGEIADAIREAGITGFAIVAGDKHSFWAGLFSRQLPPRPFEPAGVEFITGSISSQGLAEVAEQVLPRDHPLRALYVHDGPGGSNGRAVNMTVRHGVRASLALKESGDAEAAKRLSNPEVAPHLSFGDFGGHGFATVRVSPNELEAEFVCIPRPLERDPSPDGGPVAYRVRHRVPLWTAGQRPRLEQQLVEGELPLGN